MARQFAAGTSDIAYVPAFNLSGTSYYFVSAWLYRTDNTQTNKILFESAPSGTGFDVVANANVGGVSNDLIRSYDATHTWSDTYVPPAAGAWHHYVWIIAGNGPGNPPGSFNLVYIDGAARTLSNPAHNFPPANPGTNDFSIMGRRNAGVSSLFLSGSVAEFAMWSSPTMCNTPTQYVKQLAEGANPMRVRRTEAIMYLPFYGVDSPEPDYHGAQRSATLGGNSSRVNHPPTARGLVNFGD